MIFEIKTERLLLKPPDIGNSELLFNIMRKSELTEFLSWTAHKNDEFTKLIVRNFIASQESGKAYHWCIWNDSKIVGIASLIDVKREIREWTINRAELSYLIDIDFQGMGFATEASRGIMNFGYNNLELHKIIVAHAATNFSSKRICEKLGFTQYAHEHDAFNKNDQWNDLIWYEKIKRNHEIK